MYIHQFTTSFLHVHVTGTGKRSAREVVKC